MVSTVDETVAIVLSAVIVVALVGVPEPPLLLLPPPHAARRELARILQPIRQAALLLDLEIARRRTITFAMPWTAMSFTTRLKFGSVFKVVSSLRRVSPQSCSRSNSIGLLHQSKKTDVEREGL